MMKSWEWSKRVKDILVAIGFNNLQATVLTLILSDAGGLSAIEELIEAHRGEYDV